MAEKATKKRKPLLAETVPKVSGLKDVEVKNTVKKETTTPKGDGSKETVKEKISKRQRFRDRCQPLLPDSESKLVTTGLLDVVKDSSMDFATSRVTPYEYIQIGIMFVEHIFGLILST